MDGRGEIVRACAIRDRTRENGPTGAPREIRIRARTDAREAFYGLLRHAVGFVSLTPSPLCLNVRSVVSLQQSRPVGFGNGFEKHFQYLRYWEGYPLLGSFNDPRPAFPVGRGAASVQRKPQAPLLGSFNDPRPTIPNGRGMTDGHYTHRGGYWCGSCQHFRRATPKAPRSRGITYISKVAFRHIQRKERKAAT